MYYYKMDDLQLVSNEPIEVLNFFKIESLNYFKRTFLVFNSPKYKGKQYFKITPSFTSLEAYESVKWLMSPHTNQISEELRVLSDRELLSGLNINPWITQLNTRDVEQIIIGFKGFVAEVTALDTGKKRIHLLGLGDVGSTLAIGLKLLGGERIHTLGVYDINEHQRKRYEMELNQVIVNPEIKVEALNGDDLFHCDVFIFCASKYVPKVGEKVDDVRMIQFEENSKIIEIYAKMARKMGFKGLFCVVSDPVDLLCRSVLEASNQNEAGEYDGLGISAERIRGFGLGVMHGRSIYYAKKLGIEYGANGRVFGPHGKDLICVNHINRYDHEASLALTNSVIRANVDVREEGVKPYIAPAISSGAKSILDAISGNWHYSATCMGSTFFGALNRQTIAGIEYEQNIFDDQLSERMITSYERLESLWQALKS
ncbi:lactate/malate family dehydrogenase [Fusibacter ferrireducens]|uniref:Lactate dehydrogenase n=1 Tax=Fusibacter ferrireducens TaxID=2785058 RepID=A0ABR9ZRK1_9FIRM|nr:lactate dehydrogenase [Fusibacter ferrireducens]MBF4692778.1 lactate dehydrogenase [Fusibacter ferrireducens]